MNDASPPAGFRRHPNGGGLIKNGIHVSDRIYVGAAATIHGGSFHGGVFYGGVFYGGHFYGGFFRDGFFYDGSFRGGSFYGGHFYGGSFHNGVFHNGEIRSSRDVLHVGPIGSEDQSLVVYRTSTGHGISVGCWEGPNLTIDDLAAKVADRAPDFADEYEFAERLCRHRIAEWECNRE